MSREANGTVSASIAAIIADALSVKAEDLFDLRSAFLPMQDHAAMPDGDGEGDDDDDDDKGGDGGGGSGDDDASGGDTQDDIKNPKLKKLSDENAQRRLREKELLKEIEDRDKRLREIDDKDKSELEKAQRDLQEAKDELEKERKLRVEKDRRLAFYDSRANELFKNPATALKLLADKFSDLKPDDDGNYDTKEVLAIAEALVKEEPYLGKGDDDGDKGGGSSNGNGQPSGRQTNGKTKADAANDEALKKKFPALRAR